MKDTHLYFLSKYKHIFSLKYGTYYALTFKRLQILDHPTLSKIEYYIRITLCAKKNYFAKYKQNGIPQYAFSLLIIVNSLSNTCNWCIVLKNSKWTMILIGFHLCNNKTHNNKKYLVKTVLRQC